MIIRTGIDIGQKVDPTALVVAERQWRPVPPHVLLPGMSPYEDHYVIRAIRTLQLGTDYPTIAEDLSVLVRVIEQQIMAGNLENRAGALVPKDYAEHKVYVDATGVGKPVVHMMRRAGVKVTGVYFTWGDRRSEFKDNPTDLEPSIRLGKAYMVSKLQVLLQTRRLHLPQSEKAQELARELLDYEIRVSEKANDTYGAFKVGTHDDIVTALGLAVQEDAVYAGALVVAAPFAMTNPQLPPGMGLTSNGWGTEKGVLNAWGNDGQSHPLDRFR